jgi:NAD(P)-dependent dehydrogenase (short-subunit alcohol dehydrogenase family)
MKKVVLITGGSRGIGAATALLCASAGWDIALNYSQNKSAADALCEQLRDLGAKTLCIKADVSSEPQIMSMFDQIDSHFGALHGLVNNAGVVDMASKVVDMNLGRLERMMSINVIGSILCAREAIKRMSTLHAGQGGSIVNLSSVAAKLGGSGQYVDYAASKGAIDSFTYGLAKEVASEGIRVNAVRPGIIDTEIHASGGQPTRAKDAAPLVPMQRPGTAHEVGEAILWLLSEASSYTTASILDVSGGR